MKNIFFLAIATLFFCASANAQTTTVDSIAANYKLLPMPGPLTIEKTFPVLGTYQLNHGTEAMTANSSVKTTDSINATTITPGTINISLDPSNKGIIWVEGLPQGKVKAYLKKSPATYRILAQKTEAGTQVPEGTLYFDTTSRQLNIALGKAFDDVDPIAIFSLNPDATTSMATGDMETKVKLEDATVKTEKEDNAVKVKTKTATSKTKVKVKYYTAVKIEQNTGTSSTQNQ
ncbi:MAG: hypothetical protein M3352_04495 [Bacteroidota bacterium]|nr:hypothetical protein [Bacteroidota bacterium]